MSPAGVARAPILRSVAWTIAFALALALSSLVPPMESPDEDTHLGRAYLIGRGRLLLQPVPDDVDAAAHSPESAAWIERARRQRGRTGGMIDSALSRFAEMNLALAHDAGRRLTPAEEREIAGLRWSGRERFAFLSGTGYYFPAIYAPQAAALALGRTLDLSVVHTYRLARLLTLGACFALLWAACRVIAPNPLASAIWLLPMSLFQLVSPTIDGLTLSLAMLAIGLFVAAASADRPESDARAWGLALSIFLLTTSRTHLLPLLALPFWLAWRHRSRRDLLLGCAVAFAAIAWAWFALRTTSDPRLERTQSPSGVLAYYIANPAAYFNVVLASLGYSEMIAFYRESFIGILGWIDTRLSARQYSLLWGGLGVCALASIRIATLRRDWGVRLLLAGAAVVSVALAFLALLVTWTPHPAVTIYGVQGRYLTIPALLLAFALSGFASVQPSRLRWLDVGVVAAFAFVSLAALVPALVARFN